MDKKITAIIQVRMTSKRLPGKVLMEVNGKPLLKYQIERLHFSKKIDNVVIATTTKSEDDPVAELVELEGLNLYRGSEDDVLDRYYQAALQFEATIIMRLTGDCPLIDPFVCDRVVAEYLNSNADYVHTGPTFAEGVDCEIFSFSCLNDAWENAKLYSEREHCTLFFHNHPDKYNIYSLINDTDDSKYRITVDEPEDFQVVKSIIENVYDDGCDFVTLNRIKGFLDANPCVFKLNASILRNEGLIKSLREDREL